MEWEQAQVRVPYSQQVESKRLEGINRTLFVINVEKGPFKVQLSQAVRWVE